MRGRLFNIKLEDLNYEVLTPKEVLHGHKDIDLKTRSVIGVNGDSKQKTIFAKSVPNSFSIGDAKSDTKRQPNKILTSVTGLYGKARLVGIDILNKGAQIALTTGLEHPQDQEKYLPIINMSLNGYIVQMYRVLLYRYDQLKNDHFVELVLYKEEKDVGAEKLKTVHLFFPTKSFNVSIKDNETPYEQVLESWLLTLKDEKQLDAGALRTFLYEHLFNGNRKDSDFVDFTSKKYKLFSDLRTHFVQAEKRVGNTALSVFLAFSFWFWKNYGKDSLESDMMGYYGSKYYDIFIQLLHQTKAKNSEPGAYSFASK